MDSLGWSLPGRGKRVFEIGGLQISIERDVGKRAGGGAVELGLTMQQNRNVLGPAESGEHRLPFARFEVVTESRSDPVEANWPEALDLRGPG